MFPVAPFGEITERDLDADDIDGICATYPPGAFGSSCDPMAHGGLGLDCLSTNGPDAGPTMGEPPRRSGCACAVGRRHGTPTLVVLAIAVLVGRARSQRRRANRTSWSR